MGNWILLFTIYLVNSAPVSRLLPSNPGEGDWFGFAVDVSGEFLAVGAKYTDVRDLKDMGAAYMFQLAKNSGEWTEMAVLTPSDGIQADEFGNALSLQGDTLAVAADMADTVHVNTGAVYIFERDPSTNIWNETQKLVPPDGFYWDQFGFSLHLSESKNELAIGSPVYSARDEGVVYIYYRDSETNLWDFVTKVNASDPGAGDQFGHSVAISGDILVVGSQLAEINGTKDAGAVYIYSRDFGGPDNWGEVQKLIASDYDVEEAFGYKVRMAGNTILVAEWFDTKDINLGVYVFERDESVDYFWYETTILREVELPPYSRYASHIGFSEDYILIGAPEDNTTFDEEGSVFLYERIKSSALTSDGYPIKSTWPLLTKFDSPDKENATDFGIALVLGDRHVFIGDRKANVSHVGNLTNVGSGAVYIYEIPGTIEEKGYWVRLTLDMGFSTIPDMDTFKSELIAELCHNFPKPFSCERITILDVYEGSVVCELNVYERSGEMEASVALRNLESQLQTSRDFEGDILQTLDGISIKEINLVKDPAQETTKSDTTGVSATLIVVVVVGLFLFFGVFGTCLYFKRRRKWDATKSKVAPFARDVPRGTGDGDSITEQSVMLSELENAAAGTQPELSGVTKDPETERLTDVGI